MNYSSLISASELATNLYNQDWVIVDCRFDLSNPDFGRQAYLESHLPGAVYAHLEEDLSGPVLKGVTGRHPLPAPEDLAQKLGNWGIANSCQVIAYDAAGGSMAAARLWWLLKWLGHEQVAVLDGGWPGWVNAKQPVTSATPSPRSRSFIPHLVKDLTVDAAQLVSGQPAKDLLIIDVRSPERFRGEVEPIDPVAGHIPGAINAPYTSNLDENGYFLPPGRLRERYRHLLGDRPISKSVFYCGSGVTSAHTLLAMFHAGLGMARLYPGSWSEWITDPLRPIKTGQSERVFLFD